MAQFSFPYDASKYPVITITMTGEEVTIDEFEMYLKDMEDLYHKYEQFVLVFDATKAKYTSGDIRARQAKWIKENDSKIKERCTGMIYVLPNVMIEMVFKCIVAFSPLPVRYSTCRSMDAAMKEAEKFLLVSK
ncbi:MAG: hypothetical protein MUF42_06095 [Cytophagaceae bacterium]|jgi:hypothetical protein|nr:hypothetical protein [Cytophagaceae bacterium]